MAEQAPQRHSSGSSPQQENSVRPDSVTNPNVFSDDFALESFPTASDSSSPGGDGVSRSSASFSIPRPPLESDQPSTHAQDRSSPSRSSLEHGRFSTSSHDSRPLSQAFNHPLGTEFASDIPKDASRPHRSISTISNFSMPRTQSPYQGATGPSHPYGMYPQDIGLARSSSSATHSTMRMPDRSYAGPSGPSQPYGMYPQNTVPEDEISPAGGVMGPTPGFPGLGQPYRRRFGPDGEEAADLVGPDGYTEQLPPYTRYPNNVPPKNRLSALAGPSSGTTDQSPSTESESRTQTGSSQDTLNAPHSGDVMNRNLVVDDSLTQLNPSSSDVPEPPSEGGHFKERVKQKSRRRICFGRIPLWLVMVLLFIVAVLLGAVIGGVLGRVKGQSQDSEDGRSHSIAAPYAPEHMPATATTAVTATTTTTLIDAVPITSSVTLPALPTGTFTVNLATPSYKTNTCLTGSDQSAWNCTSEALVALEVDWDAANPTASISYNPPDRYFRWGAQPPYFDGSSDVMVMKDKDDPSKGPAYFFQHSFDKIVILRDSEFHPGMLERSLTDAGEINDYGVLDERDDEGEHESYLVLEEREDEGEYENYFVLEERADANETDLRPFAKPTDKPWFCFWNGTILEAFIFVTHDSNTTLPDAPAADPSVTSSTTQTGSSPSDIPAPPDAPVTSSGNDDKYSFGSYPTSVPTTSTAWHHKRQDTSPPNYPKVVKLEERRNTQNGPPPYCQRMQIMNDGTPSPLPDSSGKPIIYNLTETEPVDGHYKKRRSWFEILSTMVKRDTSTKGECQCQWIIS